MLLLLSPSSLMEVLDNDRILIDLQFCSPYIKTKLIYIYIYIITVYFF